MFKLYIAQYIAVWNFFSPHKIKTQPLSLEQLPLLRVFTPVFGLAVALPALIPVLAITRYVTDLYYVVSAVAAVYAAVVMDYIAGWQNLRILAEYVTNRRRGVPMDSALCGPIDSNGRNLPVSKAVLVVSYLLRISFLWMAIHRGNAYFIVIAATGDYLVRAEMSTVRDANSEEFFPTPEKFAKFHWYLGFCIVILSAISHSAWSIWGGVFACCIVWLVATYAENMAAETPHGTSKYGMTVFGYATQNLLLLLGALV